MFMILELMVTRARGVRSRRSRRCSRRRHPQLGRYEVCTTDAPIESVAAVGARRSNRLEPLDAFGAAGDYDRSTSRLYGGTRARVAREWSEQGGTFESITLISPYPDATLTHLLPGTMVIRWINEVKKPRRRGGSESR